MSPLHQTILLKGEAHSLFKIWGRVNFLNSIRLDYRKHRAANNISHSGFHFPSHACVHLKRTILPIIKNHIKLCLWIHEHPKGNCITSPSSRRTGQLFTGKSNFIEPCVGFSDLKRLEARGEKIYIPCQLGFLLIRDQRLLHLNLNIKP